MAPDPSSTVISSTVNNGFAGWIDHLRRVLPPHGLVHVGVGTSPLLADFERWSLGRVELIDADESQAARLADVAQSRVGWHARHLLVSDDDRSATFYTASNPRESGLLSPESLRPLWRNLQRRGEHAMEAVRLDSIFAADAAALNWLIVDCLPAANILRGAARLLEHCDVVVARAALGETRPAVKDASLSEVAALLAEHGFLQLAVVEERMPLVGRAFFMRNPAHLRQQLDTSHAEAATHLVTNQALQDALTVEQRRAEEIESRMQLADARCTELTALIAERDTQVADLQHRCGELDGLLADADAGRSSANQRAAETLARLSDQTLRMTSLRAENETQRDAQQQATAELQAVHQQLADVRQQCIDLELRERASNAELGALTAKLNEQAAESEQRRLDLEQRDAARVQAGESLRDEQLREAQRRIEAGDRAKRDFEFQITRAEAQIALIRELLLR